MVVARKKKKKTSKSTPTQSTARKGARTKRADKKGASRATAKAKGKKGESKRAAAIKKQEADFEAFRKEFSKKDRKEEWKTARESGNRESEQFTPDTIAESDYNVKIAHPRLAKDKNDCWYFSYDVVFFDDTIDKEGNPLKGRKVWEYLSFNKDRMGMSLSKLRGLCQCLNFDNYETIEHTDIKEIAEYITANRPTILYNCRYSEDGRYANFWPAGEGADEE